MRLSKWMKELEQAFYGSCMVRIPPRAACYQSFYLQNTSFYLSLLPPRLTLC